MKKFITSKASIAAIILFSLMLGSYVYKKEVPTKSDILLSKSTAHQTQKQISSEKKEDICQESEYVIKPLVKKLHKILSSDKDETKRNRALFIQKDESLKKIVIQNTTCGASSASWLANIYSDFGLKDKANEYHKMVLDFAKKGNVNAIENLCGYDSVATKEQKLHYCNIVINRSDVDYPAALFFLGNYYFNNTDGNNLIKLCAKAGKDNGLCKRLYLFPLGEKLREEKKYDQAIKYYKKIESMDTEGYGFIDYELAEMYVRGDGSKPDYTSAIFWYQKALNKNYIDKIRAEIINNMGAAYEMQSNYLRAFKLYKQAAIMGYPLGQLNIAKQYIKGHGTIQDYTQAYAWLTISIAQGLDENRQSVAEKLKNALTYELSTQDKTGRELAQAKKLAQLYYKQYVLHEKIKPQKENNNISTKIKKAISILAE